MADVLRTAEYKLEHWKADATCQRCWSEYRLYEADVETELLLEKGRATLSSRWEMGMPNVQATNEYQREHQPQRRFWSKPSAQVESVDF